jgi:hypothetical protein
LAVHTGLVLCEAGGENSHRAVLIGADVRDERLGERPPARGKIRTRTAARLRLVDIIGELAVDDGKMSGDTTPASWAAAQFLGEVWVNERG